MLQRILKLSEEKKKTAMSMENRVNDMNKLAFGDGDLEQRAIVCFFSVNYYKFSSSFTA